MKTRLILASTIASFCALSTLGAADSGQHSKSNAELMRENAALKEKLASLEPPPQIQVREKFGTFFGLTPYSNTLGLSLWNSGTLYEGQSKVELKTSNLDEKVAGEIRKRVPSATVIDDYSKMNLGTTLEFENNKGSAVLLRLRRQFQFLNETSEDAMFTYVNDHIANDSGSHIEAAIMLDWYIDAFYNRKWKKKTVMIDEPFRFWFRTGFEINKNYLPGTQEVDQQKWMLLMNFQANPDQNAKIGSIKLNSPQIVQLGAIYEQNRISGNAAWRWIIGWSPLLNAFEEKAFRLNRRMYFGEFTSKSKVTEKSSLGKETIKNQNAHWDGKKIAIATNPEHPDGWYGSIDPSINILGASTASGVFNRLKGIRSVGDLEKLREEQIQWNVKGIVGVNDGMLEFSYAVNGSHPFSKFGEVRIGQEARADFNLGKGLLWKAKAGKDWRNLTTYVSYRRGQFEPNYENTNLFTAGISTRF